MRQMDLTKLQERLRVQLELLGNLLRAVDKRDDNGANYAPPKILLIRLMRYL
jgi:hypothetical protein